MGCGALVSHARMQSLTGAGCRGNLCFIGKCTCSVNINHTHTHTHIHALNIRASASPAEALFTVALNHRR